MAPKLSKPALPEGREIDHGHQHRRWSNQSYGAGKGSAKTKGEAASGPPMRPPEPKSKQSPQNPKSGVASSSLTHSPKKGSKAAMEVPAEFVETTESSKLTATKDFSEYWATGAYSFAIAASRISSDHADPYQIANVDLDKLSSADLLSHAHSLLEALNKPNG